jgi:hypothetical protein
VMLINVSVVWMFHSAIVTRHGASMRKISCDWERDMPVTYCLCSEGTRAEFEPSQ